MTRRLESKPEPIAVDAFNGHEGWTIRKDRTKGVAGPEDPGDGVLGPEDIVGRPGQTTMGPDSYVAGKLGQDQSVAWDHPDFVKARESFLSMDRQVREVGDKLTKALVSPEAVLPTLHGIAGSTASPRLRSTAWLRIAQAEGTIAKNGSLWDKSSHGPLAFQALKKAIAQDPGNTAAWVSYAMALIGVDKATFRGMAERKLGIKVDQEMDKTVRSLDSRPNDLAAQMALAALLDQHSSRPRPGAASFPDLSARVRQRLALLKAKDPAQAQQLERNMGLAPKHDCPTSTGRVS